VDKGGFPWTLVGEIDLPRISGTAMSGDDSMASAPPLESSPPGSITKVSDTSDVASDVLADGTRVIWRHGALQANTPILLQFEVLDKDGAPASGLEPYMGMAAHAEIVASDLSVFAHLHPSGSVPMASLMMASADAGKMSDAMGAMKMPSGIATKMQPAMSVREMTPVSIASKISIPYGFPKPGLYRVFFQFKRAGQIETAVFDARVN
jgi:hypothetical protein